MLIRNLTDRTLELKDSTGVIYSCAPYDDLDVDDSLWGDETFRRNLRLRIREMEIESVTAGGGGAPTNAQYVTLVADAGLSNEKVLGTTVIMKGTLGTRPAAGVNGRLYYVTDAGVRRLTRDTGSVWDDLNHNETHQAGGLDALTGVYDINARVGVRKNSGSTVGTRRSVNFIEGAGISVAVADNPGAEAVDVTIAGGLPTGFIAMYGSATAPAGWLACDGAAVSRTTYSSLFSVISTTWGVGDGSTTFNLPDFRGRTAVGVGTNSDVNAIAKNDGMATVGDRRPKHKHTLTDPGHSHSTTATSPVGGAARFATGNTANQAVVSTNAATTGITVGIQSNAPTDGPAYAVVPYIIKT